MTVIDASWLQLRLCKYSLSIPSSLISWNAHLSLLSDTALCRLSGLSYQWNYPAQRVCCSPPTLPALSAQCHSVAPCFSVAFSLETMVCFIDEDYHTQEVIHHCWNVRCSLVITMNCKSVEHLRQINGLWKMFSNSKCKETLQTRLLPISVNADHLEFTVHIASSISSWLLTDNKAMHSWIYSRVNFTSGKLQSSKKGRMDHKGQ